jgi:hypothetical protein
MEPDLFAHLVQGLAIYDPWSVTAFEDHDLDDWVPFSDTEIEIIRAGLAS